MSKRESIRAAALAGLLAGLCPAPANAGGYACEAQCIVVASAEYQVKVLDPVEYSGGLSRREVFAVLGKLCRRNARKAGYPSGATLVDNLWFRAARDVETVRESSGSVHAEAEAAAGASEWDSLTRKGGFRHAERARARWAYARAAAGASWHSLARDRDERELEVRIIRSKAGTACEFDPEIEEGELLYPGELPVLP
jgi:hypothetical protein